ncbi:MAG: glycosyltransferase family 39 protein [Bacteroidales bacterium]|nr:glycosyltransferase family 39 protein [Bacteroidales bacterium]
MLTYFPKFFANRAMLLYAILLLLIPLAFGYPMAWYWWLFGIAEVCGFFYFSNALSKVWFNYQGTRMERTLFLSSAFIRIIYVTISYFIYQSLTGDPFEFGAADSHWYDSMGRLGADIIWGADIEWSVFTQGVELTDLGYPVFMTMVYALTGKSIFLSRCIKALLSAWTVVLMYRLARRTLGEDVGRLTAIFCMLMPNLIFYCGINLKETEMLFLTVFFIERADKIFRSTHARGQDIFLLILAGLVSYFFRGVLCALLFLSVAATVVLGSARIKKGGKWAMEGVLLVLLGVLVLWNITSETLQIGDYANVQEQQNDNMQWRSQREGGNAFAEKASAAIFAPLIFTIPFPTMVNIPYQQDQQMIHGGNFVKNITSFFTIFAMVLLLLSGKWKDDMLPLAFTLGYLFVLVFSNYAQSERFHIPSLPFELMFAAYGLSQIKNKHKTWFNVWIIFLFAVNVGWAWFKLRGRGM